MTDLKEYVITLHSREDLDDFYTDMESPGGNLYIPNRKVDVSLRRPDSRNTHYMLTDSEAEQLRADARVWAVELKPSDLGMVVRPRYTQQSDYWDKSSTNNSNYKNWGLLRCVEGVQRTNWGSDSVPNRTQSGTITVNAEGRNVDVVIVDGFLTSAHPEYAVNADGTGGSRFVAYNWFQHNLGSGTGTYVYSPIVDGGNASRTQDNNHGAHVAGTACGNTQGWARAANIYVINPYSTDPNNLDDLLLFDYIRAFHNNKPINPATGRRNPTICNNSWGYGYQLTQSSITNINYRGSFIGGAPYNTATLIQYGIDSDGTYVYLNANYAAVDADIQDAINDGIIVVAAAGNNYMKIDVSGGVDYNNYLVYSGSNYYYHRGGTPDSTPNVICVGAVGSTANETKADFSMTGPRLDIFAPGRYIMSSFNSTGSFGGVADPRNGSYYIGKISGTSMASPQVTGVLATALEVYPTLNQSRALSYLQGYARLNQMTDTGGSYSDYTSLLGATNRYLRFVNERSSTGNTWPKQNYFVRPATGSVWPRSRIRRT
jgi:hypothetical protein